jgi:hypothetical protein
MEDFETAPILEDWEDLERHESVSAPGGTAFV